MYKDKYVLKTIKKASKFLIKTVIHSYTFSVNDWLSALWAENQIVGT